MQIKPIALLIVAFSAWAESQTRWSPATMKTIVAPRTVTVSPDGSKVAFVIQGRTPNSRPQIYTVNIYGSGLTQLTRGQSGSFAPSWSPDGKWIAYLSASSGKDNIWVISVDTGETRQISDSQDVQGFKWSPAGDQIAFVAPDEAPLPKTDEQTLKFSSDAIASGEPMSRLWTVPVGIGGTPPPRARPLTPASYSVGSGFTGDFDWAPDGRSIAFTRRRTPAVDSWPTEDILCVDVATGQIRTIAATPAAELSPLYSSDGRFLAYLRSGTPPKWSGEYQIVIADAKTGTIRSVLKTLNATPELVGWSHDDLRIYYTEREGFRETLFAVPVSGGDPQLIGFPNSPAHTLFACHMNQRHRWIGFTSETPTSAPEAYVTTLEEFHPVRVTGFNDAISDLPVARTDVIAWKSADGLRIHGLLTYPRDYTSGTRYPLLVIAHGGPNDGHLSTFIGDPDVYPIAAFADSGYAILRPNVRGSTGYGSTFRNANFADWGDRDLQDLVSGVAALIDRGIADPDRVGIMGWSYGGFLAASAITKTRRFHAASIGAGMLDLASFTLTSDLPGFVPGFLGGEPWQRAALYRDLSPVFHADAVVAPVLLQQGADDTRVPPSQSREFAAALRRCNRNVELTIYRATGHYPTNPDVVQEIAQQNLEWFARQIPVSSRAREDANGARTR